MFGPDGKPIAALSKNPEGAASSHYSLDGKIDPWREKAKELIFTSDTGVNNVSNATVVINNRQGVCKKALNCSMAIEAILPDGHTLNVIYPDTSTPVPLVGKRKKPLS
ncbi:hypothetical protein GCM10010305_61140 [Streptomyces termitum]|uniref:Uncharacterized protein n=1 Tax=Streptomyces termitum TaxID=67368 RepID=A0A918WD14_9ACTN|nr:DddA-like double-stranded DNA deaminase toxin [Streptomyces termitum]GHB10087.1 hypothetical protein GCM10010305_61140 [Streptomyces termitum]